MFWITFLSLAGVVFAVARYFGATPTDSAGYATGAWLLTLTARSVTQRWRAGRVLLELGPDPMRAASFVLAALMLLIALSNFLARDAAGVVMFGCWVAFLLAAGLVPRRLCEAGICTGENIVPWAAVVSYTFNDEQTAKVKARKRLGQCRLRVPDGHRDEFIQLMQERTGLKPHDPAAASA